MDAPAHSSRSAADRIFEAFPSPAWAVALAVTIAMIAAYLGVELATGRIPELLAGNLPAEVACHWLVGDYRISIVGIVLLGYVAAAKYYLVRWTETNIAQLQGAGAAGFETPSTGRRRTAIAGVVGVAVCLIVAADISERPMEATSSYWIWPHAFNWLWCFVFGWAGGRFLYSVFLSGIRVSRIVENAESVDLFDLRFSEVCTRQGTEAAFLLLIFVGLLSVHFADPGTGLVAAVAVIFLLLTTSTISLVPMLGHRRITRKTKSEVLQRLRRRIARHGDSLSGEGHAGAASGDDLRDLLAMEERVSGVSEWPFTLSGATRIALYAAFGLGSWLGAAMVERLLDRWLS